MTKLNPIRYLRHIDLPGLGFEGQEKICAGSVAIVGMGGLGAAAALYLVGAGTGRIILIDDDRVSESNLQRQILYTEKDVGELKTRSAEQRLRSLNSTIEIESHEARLDKTNAKALLEHADAVLDCSDNFVTRYVLNDVCLELKKTLVSASVQGFAGQIATFKQGQACYRCLFPETPPKGMVPTCPEAGVFGPIVGIMGVMQAAEALKELAGIGGKDTRLLMFDSKTMQSKTIMATKNPECLCATDINL